MRARVFGGFVRDSLIRGMFHYGEDVDAAVPEGTDGDSCEQFVTAWCAANSCTVKSFKLMHRSKSAWKAIVRTPDCEDMEVQFLCVRKLLEEDPLPDFDVNTLCVDTLGSVMVMKEWEQYVRVTAADIIRVLLTRCRSAIQLKVVADIQNERRQQKFAERLVKMRERGFVWT